ncbi:hydroxymethylbilane synthase [Carboxydothermus islandicus]|uniref:Porphobilinogen deaminase n=1 Tax=Carboxydothermus islandicus TaxID=661089 RepID=A0A1L8D2P2_9THEO|nr:hydroxymethylbilane synthase [Carboxydothermus islandicus]GAV25452.1 hydroxymethylbilane synthase [Carboxydothermus islandicus]
MKKEVIVGSRDSALALWQTNWVVERLNKIYPEINFKIVTMKTKGDKILDVALAKIGDKGLFTKELEHALINKTIDMAVHSMKDLPTVLPEGLKIGAFCEREYPGDVFISPKGYRFLELPEGARIGTSSLRRIAQILAVRPDLQAIPLRGNLTTRFRKMEEMDLDGIILAYAGVKRLGFEDKITEMLSFDLCLPAVGQGSIGVEIRADDPFIEELLKPIDHFATNRAIRAERAFLKRLEGGCQIPIGAYCEVKENRLLLKGVVASLDGKLVIKGEKEGMIEDPEKVGINLAEELLTKGAQKILEEIRRDANE